MGHAKYDGPRGLFVQGGLKNKRFERYRILSLLRVLERARIILLTPYGQEDTSTPRRGQWFSSARKLFGHEDWSSH